MNNVIITGTGNSRACTSVINIHNIRAGGDDNSIEDFNPLWIAEFTKTNAYDVWQRSTDPMLFDIVEPRLDNLFQRFSQTLNFTPTVTRAMRSPLLLETLEYGCPKVFKN